jgi:hypothetical protein
LRCKDDLAGLPATRPDPLSKPSSTASLANSSSHSSLARGKRASPHPDSSSKNFGSTCAAVCWHMVFCGCTAMLASSIAWFPSRASGAASALVRRPAHGGDGGAPGGLRPARSAHPLMGPDAALSAPLQVRVQRTTHQPGAARLPSRALRRTPLARARSMGHGSRPVRRGQLHPEIRDRAALGCTSRALRTRGSALNLNVHFHTLALDGVYTLQEDRGKVGVIRVV